MKYNLFLFLLCLVSMSVCAQRTNRLDSTGNAGIGTISPSALLHVHGGNIKLTNPGTYPYGVNLDVNYTGAWAREFSISYNGTATGTGKMLSLGVYATDGTINYGYLGGNTTGISGHVSPWMAFKPNGYIGIGTINPVTRLAIETADSTENNIVRLENKGVPNSNFYLGTANNTYPVNTFRMSGVIETYRNLHISAASANSNLFFETGRIGVDAPVRMMINSVGNVGIGETSPGARFHVNGKEGTIFSSFTQEGIPMSDGALTIKNATGSSGVYIPSLSGRTSFPGRAFGLYITGEAEDVLPASDVAMGAIILDGRNKDGNRLNTNNVLSINSAGVNLVQVKANGNVGIGTTAPGPYKLAVEGTIGARKVKVTQVTPWADFVFAEDYKLPTLQEVEDFIKVNKHLPEIPTTAEVAKDGIDLAEINQKLLQKVEEQMLYIIEMNKKINALTSEMKELKAKVATSSSL